MSFLIAEEAVYQSDDQAEENMDMEEEYAVQEGEESDTQYEQEEQQVKHLFKTVPDKKESAAGPHF